jgi:hypothetical protein
MLRFAGGAALTFGSMAVSSFAPIELTDAVKRRREFSWFVPFRCGLGRLFC